MSAHMRLHDPKYLQLHILGNGHISDVSGHGIATAWSGTAAYATNAYGHGCIQSRTALNYVTMGDVLDVDASSSCSIVLSFLPLSAPASAYTAIFGKHNVTSVTEQGWTICAHTTGPKLTFLFGDGVDGVAEVANTFTVGVPHSAAYVINRSSATVDGYLDGRLIHSTSAALIGDASNTKALRLGGYEATRHPNMDIWGARIYNIALTGDEINTLYAWDKR